MCKTSLERPRGSAQRERMRPVRIVVAIDLYIGELARRGRSPATRASYERLLFDFADELGRERQVDEVTTDDCRRFLDRWTDSSPSTLASGVSLIRRFFEFLVEDGKLEVNPAARLKRPRRKRPEDLAVVSITTEQVAKMLAACEDWQELLCIASAAFVGARRAALARARRGDVDLERRTIRLLEKGGKVASKRIPDEYVALVRAAEENGVWTGAKDYLIPNRRPASVRGRERSDKVIWDTVKRVAARVGIEAHVHAFRAAYAVQFDEQHPDQVVALKELMGHTYLETTLVYLRRKNKARAMEAVSDLSFGASIFPPSRTTSEFEERGEEAHTGFEPVLPEQRLPEPLRRKLDELTARTKEQGRGRRR